jgi:hypothetical protein
MKKIARLRIIETKATMGGIHEGFFEEVLMLLRFSSLSETILSEG